MRIKTNGIELKKNRLFSLTWYRILRYFQYPSLKFSRLVSFNGFKTFSTVQEAFYIENTIKIVTFLTLVKSPDQNSPNSPADRSKTERDNKFINW